ncbi:alkanesulfonate monooxygenase SsuD/methylene tetrahydromethanopterin reductase-like flavin-dependent oxidoreductase (luciferase family) [Sphingobium sp. B1D7B]|uniref:LLM class flavin-dependent oxidoreductase n=1 Tax=unclassified Sphingobium TaxID=2611147 RepID=UPI002224A5CC|nr:MULTISPECIES: LLM class flavin-dependent oxidoreductase [unclassified Sphingobium]MCW2390693.1 alkanesulfonate monooxygenase SsuD/methylene tetrahydromethanopterin reductase-like flavin-dependent oxidoreductase (luciferase family) [Sphingobium sp. B11D3A]MCW2405834.1 alkanesulfonate monooxygenase SsuD/methylene tetrahydromethanopterin reductase-like flavin-dependent oxidoreductase (luciferase family) [Sphingobium sp. B1D7B]
MKVFVFDWTAYQENVDKYREDGVLPRLGASHFDPQAAAKTYENHLEAWAEMDKQGFDGIAINEHHGTPFGLGNSPNLMAAALSQVTQRLKILVYANLLPIHEPLRLAEEIAMLDCMSNGRLICGVGRGAPREYKIFNVPMGESRGRFNEGFEVMRRAWTQDSFSFDGEFYKFEDVSLWPRTFQQPHPPIWVPLTGSKESIEWAAEHDATITPGIFRGSMREDTIRYFAECQARHGREVQSDKISIMVDCYVADSKEQAIEEYGSHLMYLFNTLLRYDQVWQSDVRKTKYYSSTAFEHLREGAKGTLAEDDTVFNEWTMDTVRGAAQHMPIGTADEIVARIIDECNDAGANNVLLVCNRGDMPHDMYMNQVRRIGKEVLPRLQAHNVTFVPHAERQQAAE